MKFIVDELPSTPEECHMNTLKETCIPTCRLSDDLYFECKMGSEGFECPYLRKFTATAFKHIYCGDSVVGENKMPVYLGER